MDYAVFPASAGVILFRCGYTLDGFCFPRIRGGDPIDSTFIIPDKAFSPHPRG